MNAVSFESNNCKILKEKSMSSQLKSIAVIQVQIEQKKQSAKNWLKDDSIGPLSQDMAQMSNDDCY